MKAWIKKVSIGKLIGISVTVVGTISVGSFFTLNQDFRTTVTRNIRQVIRSEPETLLVASPSVVATDVLEASLDSLLREAIEEVVLEVGGLAQRFDTIDEALESIDGRYEALVAEVDSLGAMRSLLYVVIDSVLTPVDPDTVSGAEGWLRLVWPEWINKDIE